MLIDDEVGRCRSAWDCRVDAPGAGRRADAAAGHEAADDDGDIASTLVDGVDRFLLRKTDESVAKRAGVLEARLLVARSVYARRSSRTASGWRRSSGSATRGCRSRRWNWSVRPTQLGPDRPGRRLRGLRRPLAGVRRRARRGPVARPDRAREPVADVVAIPDADQTPEQIAGLAEGVAPGVAVRAAARRERLPGGRARR